MSRTRIRRTDEVAPDDAYHGSRTLRLSAGRTVVPARFLARGADEGIAFGCVEVTGPEKIGAPRIDALLATSCGEPWERVGAIRTTDAGVAQRVAGPARPPGICRLRRRDVLRRGRPARSLPPRQRGREHWA